MRRNEITPGRIAIFERETLAHDFWQPYQNYRWIELYTKFYCMPSSLKI